MKNSNLSSNFYTRLCIARTNVFFLCNLIHFACFVVCLQTICIIGITGACRREELTQMDMNHVEDHKTMILFRFPKTKTKIERSFTIVGDFYNICKEYLNIRKDQKGNTRFFCKMSDGKCENKPIGINKIGSFPKEIAKFLKLPNPELYTGHCFRRTSITMLADGGADITTIKCHSGHKSTTIAEGYIENSRQSKNKISETITKSIYIAPSAKKPSQILPPIAKWPLNEEPSTSIGNKHRKIVIPETQSSTQATTNSEVTNLISVSQQNVNDDLQDFADEFESDIAQIGIRGFQPSTINKNLVNSNLLSNILKLDKKVSIELNNCHNITFNVSPNDK